MADLASLYSLTQKAASIDTPPNPIETIKTTNTPSGVPSDFLSFYQNIIEFINQYQKAFEEENFDRMKYFVIAITEAIMKYFKGDDELKAQINGISEDTAETAKAFIQRKYNESFAVDEVQENIFDIVSEYKEKIIKKIQQLTVKETVKETPSKTNNISPNKKSQSNVLNFVVTANEIIKKKELEYKANTEKFSIQLGHTIISEFKKNVLKLNQYNLSSFQKGIKRLDVAYANHFYNIVNSTNSSINRSQGKLKTAFSKIGKTLKYTAITMVNTVSAAVSAVAFTFFGAKAILKTLFFWGGKALGAVTNVLKFGIRAVTGILNGAFKAVKFVALGIYKIGKFLIKTTSKILKGIYKLATDLWKKAFGFSILDAVKGAFKAFIFSYPGAYFLGFITGKIWGGILRLAGVSEEDIQSGNYKIKDDVLMPLFIKIKTKSIEIIFDKKKSFNEWKERQLESANELKRHIQESQTYLQIKGIKDTIVNNFNPIKENVIYMYNEIVSFVDEYVTPTIVVAGELLSILGNGDDIKTLLRVRMGSKIAIESVLNSIKFFAKHVKVRGGIVGILSAAITLGSAAIIGLTDTEDRTAKDDKEKIDDLTLTISKRYRSLFGAEESGSLAEENATFFKKYKPVGLRAIEDLTPIHEMILREGHTETRAFYKERYKKVRLAYTNLLTEQSSLNSYMTTLEEVSKLLADPKNGGSEGWNAATYQMVHDILTYNGQFIMDPNVLSSMPAKSQLNLLSMIIEKRAMIVNADIARFNDLVKNNPLALLKMTDYDSFLHSNEFLGVSDFKVESPTPGKPPEVHIELSLFSDVSRGYYNENAVSSISEMFIVPANMPNKYGIAPVLGNVLNVNYVPPEQSLRTQISAWQNKRVLNDPLSSGESMHGEGSGFLKIILSILSSFNGELEFFNAGPQGYEYIDFRKSFKNDSKFNALKNIFENSNDVKGLCDYSYYVKFTEFLSKAFLNPNYKSYFNFEQIKNSLDAYGLFMESEKLYYARINTNSALPELSSSITSFLKVQNEIFKIVTYFQDMFIDDLKTNILYHHDKWNYLNDGLIQIINSNLGTAIKETIYSDLSNEEKLNDFIKDTKSQSIMDIAYNVFEKSLSKVQSIKLENEEQIESVNRAIEQFKSENGGDEGLKYKLIDSYNASYQKTHDEYQLLIGTIDQYLNKLSSNNK